MGLALFNIYLRDLNNKMNNLSKLIVNNNIIRDNKELKRIV